MQDPFLTSAALLKKKLEHQEFCDIFRNIDFVEHLRTAASTIRTSNNCQFDLNLFDTIQHNEKYVLFSICCLTKNTEQGGFNPF